jgi:hypothetical protein
MSLALRTVVDSFFSPSLLWLLAGRLQAIVPIIIIEKNKEK